MRLCRSGLLLRFLYSEDAPGDRSCLGRCVASEKQMRKG